MFPGWSSSLFLPTMHMRHHDGMKSYAQKRPIYPWLMFCLRLGPTCFARIISSRPLGHSISLMIRNASRVLTSTRFKIQTNCHFVQSDFPALIELVKAASYASLSWDFLLENPSLTRDHEINHRAEWPRLWCALLYVSCLVFSGTLCIARYEYRAWFRSQKTMW